MTEIVFEAYPRSGNTYFVGSINNIFLMNQFNVDIKHHSHKIETLKEGIDRGLLCLSSIRHPRDACASYMVYEDISADIAIKKWIEFYSFVNENRENIVLFKFDALAKKHQTAKALCVLKKP